MVLAFLIAPLGRWRSSAEAKLDCRATGNTSIALPRTVAIASNLPGTGAHALASGLSAVASKVTTMSAKVQPYNGPNAWMPLLDEGEVEFGIINILDSNMAATGTGNYKKAYPTIRIVSGGVFPFTGSIMVRDRSEIKTGADLKGKRMAWDFGGHAITQTWQNAAMEVLGVKPSDVVQVRFSNLNDAIRGVPEGKVDATFAAIGIGINEEANAMEPIRFLSLANNAASNKILAKYGGSIVKQEPVAGVKTETTVIGYPLHLASSTKVSDKTVATLLKAWWDNLGELQSIHPQFKKWTKDVQAITNYTVPYHDGAVRFYKEVGVWTAKHDARAKEICG
jgi:TRAP transporter TAXI family solute receptor